MNRVFICKGCKRKVIRKKWPKRKYCSLQCFHNSEKQKGNPFYGKKHTKAFREKLSNLAKRRMQDPKKNVFFKDGRYSSRRLIRQEANGICQECYNGLTGIITFLDIHHKNLNENDDRLENLIALCPNCHRITHLKKAKRI